MATKTTKQKKKDALKKALLKNITDRDMNTPIFSERVDDYMTFYEQLHILAEDLEENGTMEYDQKSGSLIPRKSVAEAVRVSRELGKIWAELGITEIVKSKGTSDEDDAL